MRLNIVRLHIILTILYFFSHDLTLISSHMKDVLLSLIPGISYAAFIDGLAGVSFQQFMALILLGSISFSILFKYMSGSTRQI